MRHVLFAALVWVAAVQSGTAQTLDADRFTSNAKGLEIQRLVGSTLVGVTRDTSRIWSLYLAKDRKAHFIFASGKTGEGTYRFRARDIICFRGLPNIDEGKELCKLAKPLGRGLDWRTVTIQQKSENVLSYSPTDTGATKGSSQIVYRFKGRHKIDQNPPVMRTDQWRDKVIVGRRLSSKAAWSMKFSDGNKVTHATTNGKLLTGTYTENNGQVCLNMRPVTEASGCFRITPSNGTKLWRNANGSQPHSEIVYASPKLVAAPTSSFETAQQPNTSIRPKRAPQSLRDAKPKAAHQQSIARFLTNRDITDIKVAGNGFLAAVLEKSGGLRLINGRNGKPYAGGKRFDVTTSTGPVRTKHVALSQDGKTILYAAADTLAVLDLKQGMLTHHLTDNGKGTAFRVRHIALSASGAELLVVDGNGRVYHHTTADMKQNWVHEGQTGPLADIAFLPNGTGILLAGMAGNLTLLNAQSGKAISAGTLVPRGSSAKAEDPRFQPSALAPAPNGRTVALSTVAGDLVVLDVRGNALPVRSRKAYGGINDIAFVRVQGLDLLAVAPRNGPPELIDYATGKRRLRFGASTDSSRNIALISPEVLAFATVQSGVTGVAIWAATQDARQVLQDEWPDQPARTGKWQDQIETARRKGAAKEAREIKRTMAAVNAGKCDVLTTARPWVAAQVAQGATNTACDDTSTAPKNTTVGLSDTDTLDLLIAGKCRQFKTALRLQGDLSTAEQTKLGQACTSFNVVEGLFERAQVQLEAGQCRAAAATATSDRGAWRYLNKGFKPVTANRMETLRARFRDRCEDHFLFHHASATPMYLAAIELEADGAPTLAKQLYRQVIQRHPEDPVALRAADRLIALVDRDTSDPVKKDDPSRMRSPFDFEEIRERVRNMAPFNR